MNPLRALALVAALLAALTCIAAEKRPITPQDLWAMKRLGAPAISPDGNTIVFTVQEWSIDKNAGTTNLWTVGVATGEVKRLTNAKATEGSPVWSPDGKRIAFTSKRGEDENPSLYVIPFGGGEAEKVIELPYAVANPKWMPDGRHIVIATRMIPELVGKWDQADIESMKKEVKRRKESKMTARVTENRQYRFFDTWQVESVGQRLLRVDVESKQAVDLTPKATRLFGASGEVTYEISPDGKTIALVYNSTEPPYREELNADIYLVPTDGSGNWKNITTDNKGTESNPQWAPDGRSLVYARTEGTIHNGEFRKLWRHDLASGKNSALTEALDYSIDDMEFSRDGRTMWVTAEDKGYLPLFKLNADGTGLSPVHRTGSCTSIDAGEKHVAFLNDTTHRPNELFVLEVATGKVRQLTHFNEEAVAQLDLGKAESYTFKGANGADVHGWLVLPPKYDPRKKYALVQLMHGGPHTMNRDSWSYRWNTHVFAAPGYIVTWVNRHGSTGFGEKFAMSIVNEWGDKPFEDIMKSTDYLLQRFPNIDPNRLAAAGASYGGYMAAWVLGHTDRFKAIIDHAGVNSSYAQYASDLPHGFPQVMGGTPWGDVEGLQRSNPMFYAKNFKTPTLILHGELDYRVPYGNGLELYGVLQAMGVPSRLVVFPDENHWILKPQNAIYWHWEMQNWLSRYIGEKPVLDEPKFGTN
jgi:dipeptidyl aminopeptidase/acylaminoacyl peptidase